MVDDSSRDGPTRTSRRHGRYGALLAAGVSLLGGAAAVAASAVSAAAPPRAAQVTTSTKPPLPPLPGTPTDAPVTVSPSAPPTVVATTLAVAAPPPTVVPTSPSMVTTSTPGEYTSVTDDWGVLTMDVPTAWPYVETSPFISADRSLRPAVTAITTPDFTTFMDTSTAAGVVYEAYARTENLEPLLANVPSLDCVDGGRTPFDDGVFVGTMQAWNFCGGGAARMFVVVANAPGATFTAGVWIKTLTAADEAHATHVLGSLAFDPTAPMPTVTVPPTSVAPAEPAVTAPVIPPTVPATAPPTLPVPVPPLTTAATTTSPGAPPTVPPGISTAPDADGVVTLTDQLGRLSVDVPASWSDVNLAPAVDESDGTRFAAISAAVDIDEFNNGYAASGVYVREVPFEDDPTAYATAIASGELARDCEDGGVVPYTSATFTGAIHTWVDCDGTAHDVTVAALNPSGQSSSTVFVIAQTDDAEAGVVGPLIDSIALG